MKKRFKVEDGATYKDFGDGQEKTIRAVGKCALCRRECFDDGSDNSPFGPCGMRVASPVIAAECGEPGRPDVMACYGCHSNDSALNDKLMVKVREIWGTSKAEDKKPSKPEVLRPDFGVAFRWRGFSITYPKNWNINRDVLFTTMLHDMGADMTEGHLGTVYRVDFENDHKAPRTAFKIETMIRDTIDRCIKAPAKIVRDAAYYEENSCIAASGGFYNEGHQKRTNQAGRNVREWLAKVQDGKEAAQKVKYGSKS